MQCLAFLRLANDIVMTTTMTMTMTMRRRRRFTNNRCGVVGTVKQALDKWRV